MKRLLLIIGVAASLGACTTADKAQLATSLGVTPPKSLAVTALDEQVLETTWKAFDNVQDAVNLYLDAKPSAIGSPFMKRFADINDKVLKALTAATHALKAGNADNYVVALREAQAALRELGVVLKTRGQ